MKKLIGLCLCSSVLYGQVYHLEIPNEGPDHGNAKNYNTEEWSGTPFVRSELTTDLGVYSFICYGESDFRLARKVNNQFVDIVKIPESSDTVSVYSTLLGVSESNGRLDILTWGVQGYSFFKYKRNQSNYLELEINYHIYNRENTFWGFDKSIKTLDFIPPNQLKITKEPSKQYPETELLFEFKPEGVYKNGKFDTEARFRESEALQQENLRKDPKHYEKLVKIWKDARQQAQPNPAREPKKSAPEAASAPTNPEASTPEQSIPVKADPVVTEAANQTPWIIAAVTLFLSLFSYLFFKKKRHSV